jgi:hypothetical protein
VLGCTLSQGRGSNLHSVQFLTWPIGGRDDQASRLKWGHFDRVFSRAARGGASKICLSLSFPKTTSFRRDLSEALKLIDDPFSNTLRCFGPARSAALSLETAIHMKLLGCLLVAWLLLPPRAAEAQEHGRVNWKRPTEAEADHMASESAITDSILRKGDIVVTDRGFFMFRGFLADGRTGDFVPVPNPMSTARK